MKGLGVSTPGVCLRPLPLGHSPHPRSKARFWFCRLKPRESVEMGLSAFENGTQAKRSSSARGIRRRFYIRLGCAGKRHVKSSFAGFLGGLIILAGGLCRAQDPTPQQRDLTQMSIEDVLNLQVYAASKHAQNLKDAPSSVTIITAEEIQEYGYRTLSDILQSARSFYITSDRLYDYVGVRGFGRLGDWNSRILLLVDGHRINDNVDGQAKIGPEFPVDVDLIQRVEIVRGPSSSLYGADAFFAVINVITRKAPDLNGAELSFTPSSFHSYRERVSLGGQYKGIDAVVSDTYYSSPGPTLFFPEFDNPATNFGITSHTDYEHYNHALATISYRGFTLQGLLSVRDKGVPTAYFGALFNDPRSHDQDDQDFVDVSYQRDIGSNWQLAARTSWDRVTLKAPVPVDGSSLPPDTYAYDGQWWDADVQLNRSLLDKHKLTFGTEITDNFKQDQSNFDPDGNPPGSFLPYHSVIWAIYGQGEFVITPKLSLNAGLRYDRYYNGFGGTTNPRFGLIYHVLHSTTAKILYGSAFRAPEPYEIYSAYSPFYENNLGLRPETVRTIEGVIDQGLGDRLSMEGSIFQNWVGKQITLNTDPNNQLFVYENSEGTHSSGVELEMNVKLVAGFRARASYSFTETVETLNRHTPPNSPANLVKLNLGLPLLHQRLFAAADAWYTSSVTTLAGNTLAGFGVVNATLTGHTWGKRLDISASVYNLLNKRYAVPARPEDPENAIPQDGRTFAIKTTFRILQ